MAFQTKGNDGLAGRRLRCGELDRPVETQQMAVFMVSIKQLQTKEFDIFWQVSAKYKRR
jgi:hypothetical protein